MGKEFPENYVIDTLIHKLRKYITVGESTAFTVIETCLWFHFVINRVDIEAPLLSNEDDNGNTHLLRL